MLKAVDGGLERLLGAVERPRPASGSGMSTVWTIDTVQSPGGTYRRSFGATGDCVGCHTLPE